MLHSFAREKPVGPLQVRKYYLHFRNQKTEAQRHLLVQSHRAKWEADLGAQLHCFGFQSLALNYHS